MTEIARDDNGPDPDLDDHARLAWDAKMWDAVSAVGFDGPIYDRFVDELIRAALPPLRGAVCSDKIFTWCRERTGTFIYAPQGL